jgi:nucleotide-binding universal stress UspA family protein
MTFTRFIINNSDAAKKVVVINLLKNFHLPADVIEDFPDLKEKAIDYKYRKMVKITSEYLGTKKKIEKKILVKTGSGLKTLLKLIEEEKIDLVLMGKKLDDTGHGIITQRMGRRCPVTLLIVPEDSSVKLEKGHKKRNILVPIDFSEYSQLAIEQAVDIAKNNQGTEIFAQHVYSVPVGYHYAGKSHDEFAVIVKQNAKKQFRKFIKNCDLQGVKVTDVHTLDDNENIVEDIYNYAQEIDATGIIFGSKGMTAASSLFLGSTAEKLIKIDTKFPLMVVRRAGDHKGLLDLIQKL